MKIDTELAGIIPPLTAEEYKGLEASLMEEGCRDALVLWNDTLIDGHNRYKICTEHGITYKTIEKDFADKNAVKLWMMKNQLSRRNLNDFQRIEIVRKCEEAVKDEAKKRQLSTLTQNQDTVRVKLPERKEVGRRATEELGELAGVSRSMYEHAAAILDSAPKKIADAVRKDELSINVLRSNEATRKGTGRNFGTHKQGRTCEIGSLRSARAQ